MNEPIYTTDEQIRQMREELQREKSFALSKKENFYSRKGYNIRKILGHLLFFIIVVLLLYTLSSVLIKKSKGEIPDLFGYQFYVVETGSMSPTLKVGAVIISKKPRDPSALLENTIVTFKVKSGNIVTHRIIEIVQDEEGNLAYRTKGDNPINSPDPELLYPSNVIATFVAKVPLT